MVHDARARFVKTGFVNAQIVMKAERCGVLRQLTLESALKKVQCFLQ